MTDWKYLVAVVLVLLSGSLQVSCKYPFCKDYKILPCRGECVNIEKDDKIGEHCLYLKESIRYKQIGKCDGINEENQICLIQMINGGIVNHEIQDLNIQEELTDDSNCKNENVENCLDNEICVQLRQRYFSVDVADEDQSAQMYSCVGKHIIGKLKGNETEGADKRAYQINLYLRIALSLQH